VMGNSCSACCCVRWWWCASCSRCAIASASEQTAGRR
jgi:hypothetical protein